MGGAGRFFQITLKQRKPGPEMLSLVDQSDNKARDLQSRAGDCREFYICIYIY